MPFAKFDDRDPSVKLSNTGWLKLLDHDLFDGTVSHTRLPGASFNITFTGVSISIFGEIIAKTTPMSTYAIDDANGRPTSFSPNVNPQTQFNQKFFQSSELPLGDHTLFVKNEGDWFIFDYFIVETPDSSQTNQLPPNPSPPNPSPPNPSPPNPSPPNPPTTNPPTTNTPTTNPPPTSTQLLQTKVTSLNRTDPTSQTETNGPVQVTSSQLFSVTADTPTSAQNTSAGPPNPTSSTLVASPTDTHVAVATASHFSALAIAGVIVGVVTAAAMILVLLYFFYHKRKMRNRTFTSVDFRRDKLFASPQLTPSYGEPHVSGSSAPFWDKDMQNWNTLMQPVDSNNINQREVESGSNYQPLAYNNSKSVDSGPFVPQRGRI